MERTVFRRPEVMRAVASSYIPLKVNVDQNAELARYYRVQQWPTDVIVTAEGAEVYRGACSQDPNRYLATLDQVAAHARIGAPFSGSPSTDIAAVSRDSGATNRASAFPAWGAANSATPPAATPSSEYVPWGSQQPPQNQLPTQPQLPAQPVSTAPPAASQPGAGEGAFVTNQYAARPPATPNAHDQQASYTAAQGGQFQLPAATPPYGASAPPQPTANQFASSGLGLPTENLAPGGMAAAPPKPEITDAPQGPATLALEGYCGVTLMEQEKWVKGDPRWGAVHRGRTYLFSGSEEQQRFLANFEKYAPALSGYDCVKYAEQGALVDGKRAHGIFFRGQIFLFSDEANLQKFWGAPERFVPVVEAEQDRQARR